MTRATKINMLRAMDVAIEEIAPHAPFLGNLCILNLGLQHILGQQHLPINIGTEHISAMDITDARAIGA